MANFDIKGFQAVFLATHKPEVGSSSLPLDTTLVYDAYLTQNPDISKFKHNFFVEKKNNLTRRVIAYNSNLRHTLSHCDANVSRIRL